MKQVALILFIVLVAIVAFAQEPELIYLTPRNSVIFDERVSLLFVQKKIAEVKAAVSQLSKTDKLYIVMKTPGGDVSPGIDFILAVKDLPVQIKTITVESSSMGFEIVQNLGERLIIDSGKMLSHRKFLTGIDLKWPIEPGSDIDHFTKVVTTLDTLAAFRIGLTLHDYQLRIIPEWTTIGESAIAQHTADRLVRVMCEPNYKYCKEATRR